MGKLKTFPVDLLGTAPSNKISGEVRKIVVNGDRIFIPTGGPFFTKSLKVWAGTTLLTVKKDYQAMDLNRDATIDSGKEVCNAIQLKHSATTFTLEYQVIGGEYTDMAEELASFIKGTPINDLTKLDYSKVLYKPLVFPPSPHGHVATDWIGYGESIALLDQVKSAASVGRTKIFDAVKELAKKRIEEYVQSYIDKNGVVVTDKNPTLNGNILLVGNGKDGSPLDFDHQALAREMDERYFQNVINPLTRIGAISDSFLPLTTGFFNVSSPLISTRHSSAVAKVERNGDLFALTPASDGEKIRYVYGYARQWNRQHSLVGFKPTNQQYRPPGLAEDEEIMELFGINNQTMVAGIYKMESSGLATFKEHAIVELNDTLLQENHSLIRLGKSILNSIGSNNPNSTRGLRPTFARMRDGQYYMVSLTNDAYQGRLQVHALQSDMSLKVISSWTGYKELTTLQRNADGTDRTLSKQNTGIGNPVANVIAPFSWFKHHAVEGQDWIVEYEALPDGYSFGTAMYANDLRVHVVGNEIHCNLTFANRASMSGPSGWLQNNDALAGATYRIAPHGSNPTFHWIRTKRDVEDVSNYLVNADRGYYRRDPNNGNLFLYQVPYDMTGSTQDISAYHESSQIQLADGWVLTWRPPNSVGGLNVMLCSQLKQMDASTVQLLNGYYYNRYYRENGSKIQSIGTREMNLENPSPIPLTVCAHVMNNDLMLLEDGSGHYGGGPTACNMYLYKPSKNLVTYRTMDIGAISGFDTSDDRKSIGRAAPLTVVGAREHNGTCRWSNMVFYRKNEAVFTDQIVHRNVSLNYDAGQIDYSDAYTLKKVGFDQIEYVLSSAVGGDIHPQFVTWALIISPADPTVALLDALFTRGDNRKQVVLRTAAKLTWSAAKELTGISIRKEEGIFAESNANITGVNWASNLLFYGSWAIQYSADGREAHWHGRHLTGLSYPGNTNSSSSIHSYKMTFGADGFPKLTLYCSSWHLNGRSFVVTTPRGVGITWDNVAFGIFRVFRPFLNWDWSSGNSWSSDNSKAFVYYTPRPTVSFKIRILEDIPVQLGGVFSSIKSGVVELTDPLYSDVLDPRNKTIFVYATLNRGVAELLISEKALAESTYNVYIGKCVTDNYGVTEADLPPVMRIGNYRPSATPRGGAVSVSSGTANSELLLNWDADTPKDFSGIIVTAQINGVDKVSQNQQTTLTCTVTPTDTEITSIKWESLDNTLATVTQSGVVTALKPGRVTIRCTVNGSIVASKGIAIEEVKLITINIADGMGSQLEGSWKVLNPVFLLDKFQSVTGRVPRANEQIRFTVPATYAVTALITTTPAITVGNWPDNVDLTLVVEGAVLGRGGQGAKVQHRFGSPPYILAQATNGGPAIVGGNTMLKIINRGTIAGGGGGGGGGRWQEAGGGGGGAPYGLAGSGHYDWKAGGECQPGSFLVGGAGGRMGEGREGGYGGAWGENGKYASSNGQNIHPGKAGTALVGANFIVTNEGAGVVKGG